MNDKPIDIEQLTPQNLLSHFTRHRLLLCLGAAIAAHIVVIGLASLPYGSQPDTETAPPPVSDTTNTPAAVAAPDTTPAVATPPTPADTQTMQDRHKDSPIVKAITEAVDLDEIPVAPDDLNLSIEDTNF